MIITRTLRNEILSNAQHFPVVAILGPRQSGKTTLAKDAFPYHRYLSLEDPDLRMAAIEDPRTFLRANRTDHGIIIDEFQYAPALLSYIQTIVDEEQKPGYFVLTGSQNFLMNQNITQSLAGRVALHTLLPLSIHELKASNLLPEQAEDILFKGCYPAIYAKDIPSTTLYKNYLQTYIERDVRLLTNIGDLQSFQTFITACALRIGQPVNFTSLANDCNITDTTARRWLSILEASYIVFRLQPYHVNMSKRLTKTPKIFFYDSGLACTLLKIKADELALHPNRGNLFEGLIISDFLKHFYNQGTPPTLYFWQDKTKNEVDCIIQDGPKLTPVEIKAGRTVSQRFFSGLQYWNILEEMPKDNGFVVYAGDSAQPHGYPNLVSWQDINRIFS